MQNDPEIVFENNDFMVINKPYGITVNRSDTTSGELTLQDLVEDKVLKTGDDEFVNRGGIVHRLDKETSGVIIVAKNSEAFKALQAQFKERKVNKSYVALVHGKVVPESGEINAPVGRLPWNRKRFGVLSGGREAYTSYETIGEYVLNKEHLTLLKLYPKTGRTHQIRVHLKFINHPIFGDPLYSGRKVSKKDRNLLPRVFLHAQRIEFQDPKTNENLSFEANYPTELSELLEKLDIKKDN